LTSIVVVSELRFGVEKKGSAALARRLEVALGAVSIEPLAPDADVHYGRIRVDLERRGELIGPNDLLIAAHALSLDAVLVTDNVREFMRVKGLRLENWLSA
jgi:tRNA(fMet)-specific endonuclease VapC